jgi:hypothetical protein
LPEGAQVQSASVPGARSTSAEDTNVITASLFGERQFLHIE